MKAAVIRKAHFNAAHRLYNKAWSDEKNNQVFGLCNNPNFHGHNYELEVKVVGEIDPSTGFVIDTKKLKDIGGFDEIFSPFYCEDFELGLRAWRLGWKCYYDPKSYCIHDHSSTTKNYAPMRDAWHNLNKRRKPTPVNIQNPTPDYGN